MNESVNIHISGQRLIHIIRPAHVHVENIVYKHGLSNYEYGF